MIYINWINCGLPFYQQRPKRFDYFSYPIAEEKFKNLLQKEENKLFTEEELRIIHGYDDIDDRKHGSLISRYDDFYSNWFIATKEVQDYYKKLDDLEKEWDKQEEKRVATAITFSGLNLNKPGTLIQLDNGEMHLIGSIIPSGIINDGSTDMVRLIDTKEISRDAKVVKYCNILNLKDFEEEK